MKAGPEEAVQAGVEYRRPGDHLERHVTAYHRFSAPIRADRDLCDAFFPSVATIRVTGQGSPEWSVRIGSRTWDPVPAIALIGPTSYAGYLECAGGTLVGVGIRPFGWAQLFGDRKSVV